MTGKELLQALRDTGTGAAKLKPGYDLVESEEERGEEADALEVYDALDLAGVNPITLAKARRLMHVDGQPEAEGEADTTEKPAAKKPSKKGKAKEPEVQPSAPNAEAASQA